MRAAIDGRERCAYSRDTTERIVGPNHDIPAQGRERPVVLTYRALPLVDKDVVVRNWRARTVVFDGPSGVFVAWIANAVRIQLEQRIGAVGPILASTSAKIIVQPADRAAVQIGFACWQAEGVVPRH